MLQRPPPPTEKSQFSITAGAGHLVVVQAGRLETRGQAMALQDAVLAACRHHQTRRVIFDNRTSLAPPDDVREAMWRWVGDPKHLERVALVLESSMAAVRANMTAVSQKVRLKAFTSVDDARAWVTAPE